jgi:hypothetical protein
MSERERLDEQSAVYRGRDGDLYPEPADDDCVDGWLGEDHHGRPVPCPRCRPHLHRATSGPITGWTAKPPPRSHATASLTPSRGSPG